MNDIKPMPLPGFGSVKNRFPINKKINFTLSTQTGDIEYFLTDLNGKIFKNSTENITSFQSDEVRNNDN